MYAVGEKVKWMCPLDNDYSYGTILEIKQNRAIVEGSEYYKGCVSLVHLRYIRKAKKKKGGGGFGERKEHSKL